MDSHKQLSTLSQYDILTKKRKILTECFEKDLIKYLKTKKTVFNVSKERKNELENIKYNIELLHDESATLHTKLRHARHQCEIEIEKRKNSDREKELLERQISLVRELLVDKNNTTLLTEFDKEKLAYIARDQLANIRSPQKYNRERSITMSDDMSMYDKTGEYFNNSISEDTENSYLRSGRVYKRSIVQCVPPKKRRSKIRKSGERRSKGHNRSRSTNIITKMKLTIDEMDQVDLTPTKDNQHFPNPGKTRFKKSYSSSQSNPITPKVTSTDDTDTSMSSNQTLRRCMSSGKSLNRIHVFIQKTIIKPDTCIPCGKRIKFGKIVLRCRDCKTSCHPECKDFVPLPCCPVTPGVSKKSQLEKIENYTTDTSPKIPALIIHCISEIEQRGLEETGIYRLNGSDKQIRDLKDKFLAGKGIPILKNIEDIHTICGCVKNFLNSLKESLITYDLWKNFIDAAHDENEQHDILLKNAIDLLPQANRDTLAYLMVHFHKVSLSKATKMNLENLSRIFGPTLVGYSEINPEPLQMLNETPQQVNVVKRLLELSEDFWQQFLVYMNTTAESDNYIIKKRKSRKSTFMRKGLTTTPRLGKSIKMPNRFFSSPALV